MRYKTISQHVRGLSIKEGSWREKRVGAPSLTAAKPRQRRRQLAEVGTGRGGTKLHASVAGSRVTAFLATAAPWEPYFTDSPLILNGSVSWEIGNLLSRFLFWHSVVPFICIHNTHTDCALVIPYMDVWKCFDTKWDSLFKGESNNKMSHLKHFFPQWPLIHHGCYFFKAFGIIIITE
jgi:hypothetical protein